VLQTVVHPLTRWNNKLSCHMRILTRPRWMRISWRHLHIPQTLILKFFALAVWTHSWENKFHIFGSCELSRGSTLLCSLFSSRMHGFKLALRDLRVTEGMYQSLHRIKDAFSFCDGNLHCWEVLCRILCYFVDFTRDPRIEDYETFFLVFCHTS